MFFGVEVGCFSDAANAHFLIGQCSHVQNLHAISACDE